jgi:serine/threonine-protein kinase
MSPFRSPEAPVRPFISLADVYGAIQTDLGRLDAKERPRSRYFTIHNLWNNNTVSDRDLKLFKAALAKLINSLSRKSDIVLPEPADPRETVFRVDLDDLGWGDAAWLRVIALYPYGLVYDINRDAALRESSAQVARWTGVVIPVIRADWFITTASHPPLYDSILRLPDNLRDLERELGVEEVEDFAGNKLRRGGVIKSEISGTNRVLDRHQSAQAFYYWKSFDFQDGAGRRDVLRYPLGPVFAGNPFPEAAFRHDGGEVIFSLPNGLQGYMVVGPNGNRIPQAPYPMIQDPIHKPLGSSVVTNGVSCIVCHRWGIKRFTEIVRDNHNAGVLLDAKIKRLYATQAQLNQFLDRDETRFARALADTVGHYLPEEVPPRPGSPERGVEPIGAIVKHFRRDLDLNDVAMELDWQPDKVADLKAQLQVPELLEPFGLGGLVNGQVKSRGSWVSGSPFSQYQELAEKLGIGVAPVIDPP